MNLQEFTAYATTNLDKWVRFVRPRVKDGAEELVQAMILKLWNRHETIKPDTANALAFRELKNQLISRWRTQQSQTAREQKASKPEADLVTPAVLADQKEQADYLRQRIAEAKRQLSPRQRGAMAVKLVLRLGREEASSYLGITLSAYSGLVHQGEQRLAKALLPHRKTLSQVEDELGYSRAFDEVAEAFREDLSKGAVSHEP